MRDIDFASLNDTSGVVSAWVHGAPQGVPWQCLVCVGHVGNALVVTNTQIRSKECFAEIRNTKQTIFLIRDDRVFLSSFCLRPHRAGISIPVTELYMIGFTWLSTPFGKK